MSVINKLSVNRPNNQSNRPNNQSNRPNNQSNQPVNTSSFLQASMGAVNNTVNNTLSNVLPTSVMNSTIKPLNNAVNSESAGSYIFIVALLGIFVLVLTLVIYFRDQIALGLSNAWTAIKDLFGASESSVPSLPEQPPMNQPTVIDKLIPKRKSVFNIAQDKYTYSDAEPLCKAFGAELATYDQVKDAYDKGADWCNYGWIKGQTAVYPTQKETYDKLQAGPEDQRGACGIPGINGGYFDNPELRFGVNCYGDRPSENDGDDRYKAANKDSSTPDAMEYDKKVRDFKVHLNEIPVNSFSAGTWAA
jgi:Extracellular link domain